MKTTLIIQARMGSSRLPEKVLEEIAGRPMLDWAVQRGKRARLIDELIVATTTDDADEPIVDWARANQVRIYRMDALLFPLAVDRRFGGQG